MSYASVPCCPALTTQRASGGKGKGSATSTLPPAHLLRLQAIHQQFHRYVPHHDFVSGVENGISDCLSCSRDLTDAALLTHIDTSHPQELPRRLWTPPSKLIYVIASALWRKTSPRDSLLVKPPLPMGTGRHGTNSVKTWPSTPYLSQTGIRCLSSTPSGGSTGQEPSAPVDVRYDPARLMTPYV